MNKDSQKAGRRLRFEIFRYNPEDSMSRPHLDTFELVETPYMTLFLALHRLREEQDPSLQFDFACRSAVCGSCGMLVNGRPRLACRTLTRDIAQTIRLHPLPVFKLIGDLSVDTGTWFRAMADRVESWIHAKLPFDPTAQEARMDDDLAAAIYAGMNRIARFMLDPRDERSGDEWFDVVSSDDGVFGCLGLMACHDICPKSLPLLEVYAFLRRKMLAAALAPRSRAQL